MSVLDPGDHITVALLLRRIEAEIGGCRRLLAKIEAAVETLLQAGPVADDDPLHVAEMQNFDLLDQTLADLVICMQDLASAPPVGTAQQLRVAHITRRMRLSDLRGRLNGTSVTRVQGNPVELF